MKFKKKRGLEIYFHTTYIDQTTINEPFEIQYISIDVNEEIDLSSIYSKQNQ